MIESYRRVFKAFDINESALLLKNIRIEVKDKEGTFRSFKDIFKDISNHIEQ